MPVGKTEAMEQQLIRLNYNLCTIYFVDYKLLDWP